METTEIISQEEGTDSMNEENKITHLIEQIKNGDEQAFADFYSSTYKYVYSRAKCMFSDEQEAQDLTQEVYLAVYRNIDSLQSAESVFAWLRTITFYQGTKLVKKKRKEVLLAEENEGLFEELPDEGQEIEDDYVDKQDIEIIRDCINQLSDEQRTVVLAYYYDNLKVEEIAEQFAISAGTIKSRLYLARKNLKSFIEAQEKKQGYKLHSLGLPTLSAAIGLALQQNMSLSTNKTGILFSGICKELGIANVGNVIAGEVAKTGAQKVVAHGIRGFGKKIALETAKFSVKKIAISVTGILAATAVTGSVIVGMNNNNSDKEEIIPKEEIEFSYQEENEEEIENEASEWELLGDKQQYLAFGENLYRKEDQTYGYTKEFVDVLYIIADGWFSGASKSDLDIILQISLEKLPDTATAKEVYDALYLFAISTVRELVITGEGESPYEYLNRMASPYASERCGFVVGTVFTFTNGATCTYQGQDIWTEANGRTWKANDNNKGGIWIEIYTTSPYYAEQAGFMVGEVCDFGPLKGLTYQGQDIWVNSSGTKYKSYKISDEGLHVDIVKTYDNVYPSYTFAKPGETPISEREGYAVGHVIHYDHIISGNDSERIYQGNDVWLRQYETGESYLEIAAYDDEGKFVWVEKLD